MDFSFYPGELHLQYNKKLIILIAEHLIEEVTENWQRKFNRNLVELVSSVTIFVKGQIIQPGMSHIIMSTEEKTRQLLDSNRIMETPWKTATGKET